MYGVRYDKKRMSQCLYNVPQYVYDVCKVEENVKLSRNIFLNVYGFSSCNITHLT